VTLAVKQETRIISFAMETQQLVFVCTVELHDTVSNIKCAKFLI